MNLRNLVARFIVLTFLCIGSAVPTTAEVIPGIRAELFKAKRVSNDPPRGWSGTFSWVDQFGGTARSVDINCPASQNECRLTGLGSNGVIFFARGVDLSAVTKGWTNPSQAYAISSPILASGHYFSASPGWKTECTPWPECSREVDRLWMLTGLGGVPVEPWRGPAASSWNLGGRLDANAPSNTRVRLVLSYRPTSPVGIGLYAVWNMESKERDCLADMRRCASIGIGDGVARTPKKQGPSKSTSTTVKSTSTTAIDASRCITHSSDDHESRSFAVRREGTNVRFSFFRTPKDVNIGILRYATFVLHPSDKIKSGDRRLPWGYCSANNVVAVKFNAYDPSSNWTCGRSAKRPCTQWAFNEVKKSVRDEANGVALVGYGASGEVLLRLYKPFNERLEGTERFGKVWSLACKAGRIGDPLSRSVFLGSKAALSTIGLVTGRQEAGFAAYALDQIAIGTGMDPKTGRVKGTLEFTLESRSGKSNFLSEADKASFESSIEYFINEAGGELGKWVARSGDQTIYRQVGGELTRVSVGIYFTASTAHQFVKSLEQWSETAATWDGLCDVWTGR